MAIRKWRLEAAKHNSEAGEKHKGRVNKVPLIQLPKYAGMGGLLLGLYQGANLFGTKEEKE